MSSSHHTSDTIRRRGYRSEYAIRCTDGKMVVYCTNGIYGVIRKGLMLRKIFRDRK